MKKVLFVFLCMYFVGGIANAQQANFSPFIPEGYYLEDYNLISQDNWQTLKKDVDVVLDNLIFTVENDSALVKRQRALYALSRLYSINWSNEKRCEDVTKYLTDLLLRFEEVHGAGRNGFDNLIKMDYPFNSLMFFPSMALQIIFKVNYQTACNALNNFWLNKYLFKGGSIYRSSMKRVLIKTLYDFYESECVNTICNQISQLNDSKVFLDRFDENTLFLVDLKYHLKKSKSQKKAWNYIISVKADYLKAKKFVENEDRHYWWQIVNEFKKVFPYQEIDNLFALIKKEKDPKLKYVLSYSGCLILNGKQNLSKTEKKIRQKLLSEIDLLRNNNEKIYKTDQDDFLFMTQKITQEL